MQFWYLMEMFLCWTILPVVGVAAICNILGKVFVSARQKAGRSGNPILLARISRAVYFLAAVSIIAMVLIGDCEKGLRLTMLSNVSEQHIESVVIECEKGSVELASTEAKEFMGLLRGGRDVRAHHSSRINIRQIEIKGETDYFYTLGEDDSVSNEFWLMDVTCPGCIGEGRKVRQFASPKMTEFLESHVPVHSE